MQEWQAVVVFYQNRVTPWETVPDQVGEVERLLKHQWGFLFEEWEPGQQHPLAGSPWMTDYLLYASGSFPHLSSPDLLLPDDPSITSLLFVKLFK